MREFRVGDIVRISRKSIYYENPSFFNPKDVNGVISEIIVSGVIRVRWDSEVFNNYNNRDLSLVRRPDTIPF